MASDLTVFAPLYVPSNTTVAGSLLASTTVAATAAAVASTVFSGQRSRNEANQVQIANTSAAWAYVNFGAIRDSFVVTAATVATGYPVAPGAVVIVTVDPEVNAASVILATGTGNVIFTRGTGI